VSLIAAIALLYATNKKKYFYVKFFFLFSEPIPKEDITNNPSIFDAPIPSLEVNVPPPILPVPIPVRVAPLPPNIVPPITPRVKVPKLAAEEDQQVESGEGLLILPSKSIRNFN
jgi:hypothetical protein